MNILHFSWIDGSVENDLPMLRLSELFNVNHFIVSQVNPHVVPFLSKSASPSPFYRVISGAFFLLKSEIQHRLHQLIELDILPTTLHRLENVLAQKYHGDITIVPEVRFRDYLQLISNPSREFLWDSVMRGACVYFVIILIMEPR
jgi:predicted acylesterase/phospholipase RssA